MGAWRAEPQAFETEVSGRAVFRLRAGEGPAPENPPPGAWLVSCRVDEHDAQPQSALRAAGFTPVETLVTFERGLDEPVPDHEPLAAPSPKDHAAVISIALTAFTHDRFHADARVPGRIADELKARWAENGLNGRNSAALVARGAGGAPEGFILIDLADGAAAGAPVGVPVGVIDLIAVDPGCQGRGAGRRLVLGACAWARNKGAKTMRVGTQAENAVSLRLYQSCGFAESRREITFHRTAPRIGAAVFARMDSARLPGKALADLGGRPVLSRVLGRVRLAGLGGEPVIATSARAVDDEIAHFAKGAGAQVFRGAADDVLGRAAACAREYDLDALVRISGDSPFIDPAFIRCAVDAWLADPALEIVTNVCPRTFPPGLSIEVISRALLDRLDAEVTDAALREHVTRAVYDRPDGFRLHNIESEGAARAAGAGLDLAVDDAAGLARARGIINALGPDAETAPLAEVLKAAGGGAHKKPSS
ncbi:MAG: GNAT family N-acetyltransferase [Rhodospirillales bacterium]